MSVSTVDVPALDVVDAEIIDDAPRRPGPDAQAIIDGLLNLAAMIELHPGLVDGGGPLRYAFDHLNVFPETRAGVAALARIGLRSGAKVTKHQSDTYAGVDLHFGRPKGYAGKVTLSVRVDRDEICERVVTGTKTVTREVPDPDAPKISVTETVEEVEWRCRPILPAEAVTA